MKDKEYFPVPLAHLTSPFVPPQAEADGESPPPAAPVAPPYEREGAEPWGMLDVDEPPELYGRSEITVLARDPFTLFAHWEVTPADRAAAVERLGADGVLVLRLDAVAGPIIDEPLGRDAGRGYLPAPFPGAALVPVVGLRGEDGAFEPIASGPRVRVPWNQPEEGPVEWAEIDPARTRGLRREPPVAVRRGAAGEAGPAGDEHALWPSAPAPSSSAPSSAAVVEERSAPTSPSAPTPRSGGLR